MAQNYDSFYWKSRRKEQREKRNRSNRHSLEPEKRARERELQRMRRLKNKICKELDRPFVGVDGEGWDNDGRHEYTLLRAGEKVLRPRGGETRLKSRDIFEFLSCLNPEFVYVGYYYGYDAVMSIVDLNEKQLRELNDPSSRVRNKNGGFFPVRDYVTKDIWYEIDYIPQKFFKVRKCFTGMGNTDWVEVNDVGSFFQCKFYEALELWGVGTETEREQIRKGKSLRGEFENVAPEIIEAYNQLEIELLEELMRRFRDACVLAGYWPRKWQGPGLLAEAGFEKHGVPKSKDVPLLNDPAFGELIVWARNAFYGGRSETSIVGEFGRATYAHDRNSAYPTAMLDLPCLLHGGWSFRQFPEAIEYKNIGFSFDYAIVEVSFQPNSDQIVLWYGLPIRRKDGSIYFPGSGSGWYWNMEVEAAIHQDCLVKGMWYYTRHCDCQAMACVKDIYEERKRLGKDRAGIVLKLMLNSYYGKRVQSIGKPKYSDPITGSFLTAHCRAEISAAMHLSKECGKGCCGQNVLMVATDSIVTTDRLPLPIGETLGEWSVEEHPQGIFFVQPGLYYGSSGKRAKTRGIPGALMTEYKSKFKDAFEQMLMTRVLDDGDVYVPQVMFVGLAMAIHWGQLKLLGQWIEVGDVEKGGKRVSFDWKSKRRADHVGEYRDRDSVFLKTYPYEGSIDAVTVPYKKSIGVDEFRLERAAIEGQPDWIERFGEER